MIKNANGTKIEKIELDGSPEIPAGVTLHDYQKEAIENWSKNNYTGIFDMATGTGKTFTGLGAITKLYKDLKRMGLIYGESKVFTICQRCMNKIKEGVDEDECDD